jgi:hypothetical protein
MAGFVPAINAFRAEGINREVDPCDKPGHDGQAGDAPIEAPEEDFNISASW